MGNRSKEHVYIFHGTNAQFAASVYSSFELAELDIKLKKMSGLLSIYPLNETIYDYCVRKELFDAKDKTTGAFIQNFTSAYLEHHHYKHGNRLDEQVDE